MSRSWNNPGGVFAVGLLLLIAACSTTAIRSASTPAQNAESQVPRITVEELKKLMADQQVVVVDVRSVDAYNTGHIKGAINLPLGKIQAGDYNDLPRDKRVITYCSCGAEQSSAAATSLLEKAGFKNGATLLGGTNAWQQSGGEMEKNAPKAKP